MANCRGCNFETHDDPWGNWCDRCGGVVLGDPPVLFFRHVATADGAGGRFAVVFDPSANAYGVAWPRKVVNIRCVHCGLETPMDVSQRESLGLEGFRKQVYQSARGPLDAMIAVIQPHAQGDSSELPSLHPAPTATDQEREILGERL